MNKSFPLTSSKASQINFVAVTRKKTSLRTSAVRHILRFILRSFSVRSPFVLRSSSVDPPFILRSRSVQSPFGDRRTIEETSEIHRMQDGDVSKL